MAISELCKDGIRVRLLMDNERLYLQVYDEDADVEDAARAMPCDPDALSGVLMGLTYQLSSESTYCVIRRTGPDVSIEFQTGNSRRHCSVTVEEFKRVIMPVMPSRLRAMLL